MTEREKQRLEFNRQELAERISRALPTDGFVDPFEGVRLTRMGRNNEQVYADSTPAVCFIAQGAKEVYLGGTSHRYDPSKYLLATVELPVRAIMLTTSAAEPYLGLRIDLDAPTVGSVMVEAGLVDTKPNADTRALCVNTVDSGLYDAATRLVRLLDDPKQARILIPQVKREIIYRLLMGPDGHRLRHLPNFGGHTHVIAQALEKLRSDFDQPLSIEGLAKDLGMSSTRFHHHFKSVTDMSPLQFQKQIRLQEARRLMLSDEFDASSAGLRVGYEDASHFSRDYKKHFGMSPIKDIERLRAHA